MGPFTPNVELPLPKELLLSEELNTSEPEPLLTRSVRPKPSKPDVLELPSLPRDVPTSPSSELTNLDSMPRREPEPTRPSKLDKPVLESPVPNVTRPREQEPRKPPSSEDLVPTELEP